MFHLIPSRNKGCSEQPRVFIVHLVLAAAADVVDKGSTVVRKRNKQPNQERCHRRVHSLVQTLDDANRKGQTKHQCVKLAVDEEQSTRYDDDVECLGCLRAFTKRSNRNSSEEESRECSDIFFSWQAMLLEDPKT